MNRDRFISGIFSVYDSSRAENFEDSDRYPIGFEAIFHNDKIGQEFAANLAKAIHKLSPERGVLYNLEGEPTDKARQADCFFKDIDALRQVLNESLAGIAIHHEERGVLPKFVLIEDARDLVAAPVVSR